MKSLRIAALSGAMCLLTAPAFSATPGDLAITWMESTYASGDNLPVTWNMWWGNNGDSWSLLDNGTVICEGTLTPNGENAQTATCTQDFAIGAHSLVAKLCLADDCSSSAATVFSVGNDNAVSDKTPWEYLDNSEWEARKAAGMREKNKPYNNTDGKRVATYFVEWGVHGRQFYPKDIPVENLTHIMYGFIPICGPNTSLTGTAKSALDQQCADKEDYQVVVHDKYAALEKNDMDATGSWDDPVKGIFAEFYRMKMTYPDVKIIPSVGGWTLSDPFYEIASNPAARATFITSIIALIDQYDFFDGIDIDWEFPGGGGANSTLGSPDDGKNFAILMQELRAALDELEIENGRTYELTAAVSGGVSKISEIDWENAIDSMDQVNVMTYDYYGTWDQTYGHQTGIYDTDTRSTLVDGSNANDVVNYLTTKGVAANKISVGVAMYGRGWTGITNGDASGPFVETATGGTPITGLEANGFWEDGIVDYQGIEENQLGGEDGQGANGFELFWDDIAKATYLWNETTGTFISFDDKRSVKAKGDFVTEKGLGGIFSWEIDSDNGTLLNAMHEGLGHTEKTQ
ncbi:chitinase [Sinobacterium caligoides]|uniref:chitinase n=1 Tax=Sinobacterium caligoides TaxID=933926 RepID=A0A3N2DPS6_9GAMM|nr:glycosyl hydrolase family 18 protein [Sinobacterium caligoides]ROS01797.1 chitinase [Sinobacterium caligoides]